MVYDAPLLKGTFEYRLDIIQRRLAICPSRNVKYLEHSKCKGKDHLMKEAERIIEEKGEGVMIKDPKCTYEIKRSPKLLKVKKIEDAEATVTGHTPGTGKYTGMCGALEVRNDQGVEFKIGSGFDDAQRMDPPKIGSRITYKFQGHTNDGKPRFAIFLRVHPGM